MPAVQVKLTEFSELTTRYTSDFVGREWLVKQVTTLLDEPDCRFVVLTGGPGVGKTAFLAHLAAIHHHWPRYFIRRDSKDLLRPGDANTFLLTIGGQLATLYPQLFHPDKLEIVVRQRIGNVEAGGEAIGARIKELHVSPFYRVALLVEQEIRRVAGKAMGIEIGRLVAEPRLIPLQDLQYMGLLDPARLLAQEQPDAHIVVLVDALDELRYSPAEPDILRVLRELPELPPNVRFVVSSRREAFLGRLLARSDARELPLNVGGSDNQIDLRVYAENIVVSDAVKAIMTAEHVEPAIFIRNLLNKSAGNFLYLKSVLTGIQETLANPRKQERLHRLLHVEELPADLGALYGHFIAAIVDSERLRFGEAVWRDYLRPLLGTLAIAQEPLSEALIMAFSGLKQEDIRDVLRELRQFVETVGDESPLYRIYHTSFAEYLLDSERNRDYWIDGQERHNRFANRYLDNWGGLNAELPQLSDPAKREADGWYGLHHLVTHLDGARRADDLHRLLTLETSKCRNAWYEAKEAIGDIAGFLADVQQAWRLSEDTYVPSNRVHTGKNIGLQARYALITASINSLAENIPPTLLLSLVQKGVWLPAQGLAYAQRMSVSHAKTEALVGLIQYADESMLLNLLLMVRATEDKYSREFALSESVIQLTKLGNLDSALAIVQDIDDEKKRTEILARVPILLAESGHYEKALTVASQFGSLINILPYLPEKLFQNALTAAQQIESDWDRCVALACLASRMAETEHTGKSLEVVQVISRETVRASALVEIAPKLSKNLLWEALTMVRRIGDETARSMALIGLIPHLPSELVAEVQTESLATIRIINDPEIRAKLLIDLLPSLPDELAAIVQTESLATIRTIKSIKYLHPIMDAFEIRSHLLVELILQIPEENRALASEDVKEMTQDICDVLEKIIRRSPTISDMNISWVKTLASLIPYLPKSELNAALDWIFAAARKVRDRIQCIEPLTTLAIHLPEQERALTLREVLSTIREIYPAEPSNVEKAWNNLIPHLSESLLQEALGIIREIWDVETRAGVWVSVYPYLSVLDRVTLLDEILNEIHSSLRKWDLDCPFASIGALNILAPHLSENCLRDALKLMKFRSNDETRKVLIQLSVRLAELGYQEDALAEVQHMTTYSYQATTLMKLAPYLSEKFLFDAIAMARRINDKEHRNLALDGLAIQISKLNLHEKMLTVLQDISDDKDRAEALASLPREMAKFGYTNEALAVLHRISDDENRTLALVRVAVSDKTCSALSPFLPKNFLSKILRHIEIVLDHTRTDDREAVFANLICRLAELGYPSRALVIVRDRRERDHTPIHVDALIRLAPYLSENQLRNALAVAPNFYYSYDLMIREIVGLAPYLPQSLLHDALVLARKITRNPARIEALIGLLPYLSDALKNDICNEALAAEREIYDYEDKAKVLPKLAPYLSELQKIDILRGVLKTIKRENLLKIITELAPFMPESILCEILGNEYEIRQSMLHEKTLAEDQKNGLDNHLGEIYAKMRQARFDQTQVEILAGLVPYLSSPLLSEALTLTKEIENGSSRTSVLISMAPYLNGPLIREALTIAREIEDEDCQAKALIGLSPHLPKQLLQEALAAMHEIGDRVNRAYAYASIIPLLSETERTPILNRLLAIAQGLERDERIKILVSLVSYLPEMEYVQVLKDVFLLAVDDADIKGDYGYRPNGGTQALACLMGTCISTTNQVPNGVLVAWQENLITIAGQTRKDMLLSLCAIVPFIATMGKVAAIEEMTQAIQDVGRWWP